MSLEVPPLPGPSAYPVRRRRGKRTKTVAAPESIAIIIASKNRPTNIRTALASIESGQFKPTDVVVVDQSDTAYDLSDFPAARHIYDPSIPGLTAARNRGVSEVDCERILFIDDDVALMPTTLGALQAAFSRCPDAVGFQCDDVETHDAGRLSALLDALFERGFFSKRRRKTPTGIEVSWLGGFAMAYRSSLFSTERFDERLSGYCFGEDWEFSLRASRYGRLLVAEGAELHHYHSPVNRAGARTLCKMRWINYQYFFRKHRRQNLFDRLLLAWWKLGEAYRWWRAGLGLPSTLKAAPLKPIEL
jgi:GT2 family glycosyltransferase